MIHEMGFTNPENLANLFTTVRLGDKWHGAIGQNDMVCAKDADGNLLCKATPISVWMGTVADVPASLLEIEQNTLHRTYSGLMFALSQTMQRQVEPTEIVSVVVLSPVKEQAPRTRAATGPRILMARRMPRT